MAAEGGWTLAEHLNSTTTNDKITSSRWDFVILQEQSQIPASEEARRQGMVPAARALASKIRESGAGPVLFMTWAHRGGWPQQGSPDYETMQSKVNTAYLQLARELSVPVAPVGYGWGIAIHQYPELDLWQADGSHPTEQGTYLAACTFYAVFFRQSPIGLGYQAGLPKGAAQSIQMIASDTVLGNPSQWNLP